MTADSLGMEDARGPKVGFICVRDLGQSTYRAGLLVLDAFGKPLEFRATNALRPDKVQRILYGASLFPTIARDLCGRPLLDSLRDRPEIVLADHEAFLPLHTPQTTVVYLRSAGETLEIDTDGERDPSEEEIVPARFEPLTARFAPGVADDHRLDMRRRLRELSENINLLEPFERISRALEAIHKQEAGKRA